MKRQPEDAAAPSLPGLEAGRPSYEAGRSEERAAWLAWLRTLAETQPVGCGLRLTYGDLADRGERGEHRKARAKAGRRKGAAA